MYQVPAEDEDSLYFQLSEISVLEVPRKSIMYDTVQDFKRGGDATVIP